MMVAVYLGKSILASDLEFGGTESVSVTCKRRVGEVDQPTLGLVTLLSFRGKKVARQKWSDASTGMCVFPNLETTRNRYIAVAEYPANPDNPNEENYLRPVAGVSALKSELP